MRSLASVVVPLVLLCGFTSDAPAQVIGIQQPVVGVHSVHTTVVVPDRGELFIGGIGHAATAHRHFGPFGACTCFGLERRYSGMSVRVRVHDLRAMDRAVLNRAKRRAVHARPGPELTGNAGHAYRSLLAGHRKQPADTSRIGAPARQRAADSGDGPLAGTDAERAARFEHLGRKAERAGKPGVARLHYRMAVKYGSEIARRELAELADRPQTAQAP